MGTFISNYCQSKMIYLASPNTIVDQIVNRLLENLRYTINSVTVDQFNAIAQVHTHFYHFAISDPRGIIMVTINHHCDNNDYYVTNTLKQYLIDQFCKNLSLNAFLRNFSNL